LPYLLKVKPHLAKTFKKLGKKDPAQLEAIHRKVNQILEEPYRFKPLRAPMQNKRRVHVIGPFVLVYAIHESEKVVELWDYDHHDNIYQ